MIKYQLFKFLNWPMGIVWIVIFGISFYFVSERFLWLLALFFILVLILRLSKVLEFDIHDSL
jgi:hypothetical protein